jgi:hypothetical protein
MERIINKENKIKSQKNIYRVFAIILTIVLVMQVLLPHVAMNAFADPVSTEIKAGDEVEVTISTEQVLNGTRADIYLLYDTAAFSIVADSYHAVASGQAVTLDKEFLTGDEGIAAINGKEGTKTGSRFYLTLAGTEIGDVATVKLRVKDDADVGDYTIEVFAKWGIGAKNGFIQATPSTVTVIPAGSADPEPTNIDVIALYGGTVSAVAGDQFTVTPNAANHYVIDEIYVDGVKLGGVQGLASYTTAETPAKSIVASFAYTVNF